MPKLFLRGIVVIAVWLLLAARVPAFSLLTYNVNGNGATNWSTNAAQVQAIGRQVRFLQPDIITFNEIPYVYTWQMANFVTAFLPGYYLATNSATDGAIRNAVASRYAIVRSQSWLHSSSLASFGVSNNARFTRDLFEAEISVPHFAEHLHVFVAHLKAFGDLTNAIRRAAEASSISNFFMTNFLPAHAQRPYLLAGDMNEDIAGTLSTSRHPIQRLANDTTGLRLTTPLNPVTRSERTYSIRDANLSERIDYIFPCGMLSSNIYSSQVFRSDRLNPLPSPLLASDGATASDHLPVLMVFNNPYDLPFRLTSLIASNQALWLSWQALTGRQYRVEGSSNLVSWTTLTTNLTATTTNASWSVNRNENREFLRVSLLP